MTLFLPINLINVVHWKKKKWAIEEFDKALAKAKQQGNEQAIKDALPTIDLDLLDLEEIDEFDETLFAGRQMSGPLAVILKIGKFLLKYGKLIYNFIQKATKTVNLVKVNNQIQSDSKLGEK